MPDDLVTKRSGPVTGKRYPPKMKMMPMGPDALLRLESASAKKKLTVTMEASSDSRTLKLTFTNKEGVSEDFSNYGTYTRDAEGNIVSHRLVDFGIYGSERTYELETPKGATLMLRRGENGDLTMWVKGNDIAGSEEEAFGSRKYAIIHKRGGKTVGYTIKDFLLHVNSSFTFVMAELPIS